MTQLVHEIARSLGAQRNCEDMQHKAASHHTAKHYADMSDTHAERIAKMVREYLPSGAGFDSGTKLNEASKPERLIFDTSFHHMSENGYYTRWTEHSVIVTPSLLHVFDLKVTGRDHNGIKEYIADAFHTALSQHVTLDTLLKNDAG